MGQLLLGLNATLDNPNVLGRLPVSKREQWPLSQNEVDNGYCLDQSYLCFNLENSIAFGDMGATPIAEWVFEYCAGAMPNRPILAVATSLI
jgi:hypothetical protein